MSSLSTLGDNHNWSSELIRVPDVMSASEIVQGMQNIKLHSMLEEHNGSSGANMYSYWNFGCQVKILQKMSLVFHSHVTSFISLIIFTANITLSKN